MKTKTKLDAGQGLFGFWDKVNSRQDNNSFRRVDAAGKDCAWRNGLEDWLRFFSPLSGGWNVNVDGGLQ